jgi:hypothetical protein
MPQYVGSNMVSPAHYRNMVNAFAASVHGVHADNFVIAGATAPFGHVGQPAPLAFLRKLLCLSPTNRVVCRSRIHMDAWATHPYTNGGPMHQATWPNDVSIGDLPEVRRVLRKADRAGLILGARAIDFWVTEFSWDTRPVDTRGVPNGLHARWVAEGLYRMWRSGVTVVTWWLLRDRPFPEDIHQSGLYYCGVPGLEDDATCYGAGLAGDHAKLSLTAFRFPFVAIRESRRLRFWGRTPNSLPGVVAIERRTSSGWKTWTTVNANGSGLFGRLQRSSLTRGTFRAKLIDGTTSVPFSLGRTRDLRLSHPFGCGGHMPC